MDTPLLAPGRTLGIVGAGVMGTTIARGLLETGLVSRRQVWAGAKTQATCEEVARTVHISRQLGPPIPIPAADIDALYDRYQNAYGQK